MLVGYDNINNINNKEKETFNLFCNLFMFIQFFMSYLIILNIEMRSVIHVIQIYKQRDKN